MTNVSDEERRLLTQVAAIICEETCGLTSECKSREAARALYDKGYLRALAAQQDVREADEERIREAVERVLAEGLWPEYETQDDMGLDVAGYTGFVVDVLKQLGSVEQSPASGL